MKIGFALPNIGPVATAEAVVKVAQRAEALAYHSLWTIERLLWPVKPQTPYTVTPDGSLPEQYKYILDPLDTLTFAAAHTKTITLGTSVLDIPYHNPVTLRRRLTTIDFLSHGRLRVGLGLGWSKDEMDATGADMKQRGAMADEFLQALKAIWTTNPVEFHGKFYQIPKSYMNRKPVQKPHPPIYLAAFATAAMKRLATVADGWNPVMVPVDGMAQNNCNQIQTMVRSSPNADQPIVVSMMELRSNAAMYYGKTVTVDGELPIVASSTRKRHGVSIRPPFAEFPGCGEVG